jgi:hypothetical protein
LFASSLALGLGLLGGLSHGRTLEKYARASVTALDHFAKTDSLAMQYSLICKSLVETAVNFLEKQDLQERKQRTESSSQMFGLMPEIQSHEYHASPRNPSSSTAGHTQNEREAPALFNTSYHEFHGLRSPHLGQSYGMPQSSSSPGQMLDLSVFDGLFEGTPSKEWGGMNLFPIVEDGQHLDFTNYL